MAKQISTGEENAIMEMHGMLYQMLGEFKGHTENGAIHQQPPCSFHQSLSAKLWALAVAAVTGLVISTWNAIK